MTSEDFPVQCSIDGGDLVNCEYISVSIYCHRLLSLLGSSPYDINTASLSRGEHNITFSVTIDGVVRGLATQTFTVLEGTIHSSTSDNQYNILPFQRWLYNLEM